MAAQLVPAPDGHDPACMCPPCLNADMDQHIHTVLGLDPSRFATSPQLYGSGRGRRGGGGGRRVPIEQDQSLIDDAVVPQGLADDVLDADAWADLDPVPVWVMSTFVGVWARFTGCTPTGEPVTVTGAVVAGPTVVDISGRQVVAVLVRDYKGSPDRVVYTAPDADAELVDDPADVQAQMRCGADDWDFGPVARVDLLVKRSGLWCPMSEDNPTPERVAALERHAVPGVRLAGVWRGDVPVPARYLT